MEAKLKRLTAALNYSFADQELLLRALTHRSFAAKHNERLEFLGDAVLNCAIAAYLVRQNKDSHEGALSRQRALLVRQAMLTEVAQSLSLGDFIRLGVGELKSGGRQRPSILADTLEAILGAIFLDSGYEAASAVIEKLFTPMFIRVPLAGDGRDAKTALQEWLQGRALPRPEYRVIFAPEGATSKPFEVHCIIESYAINTRGFGSSRRSAEQSSAQIALEKLQEQL